MSEYPKKYLDLYLILSLVAQAPEGSSAVLSAHLINMRYPSMSGMDLGYEAVTKLEIFQ